MTDATRTGTATRTSMPPHLSAILGSPEQLGTQTVFDVVVCGAGASGSVVAARLAQSGASVLLVEAGPRLDRESVSDASRWPQNLGTDAVWNHVAEAEPGLGGRALYYPTGRGLGGGGAVNACTWARGHRSDWDSYAAVTGDEVWDYAHVLDLYRRIEAYQGAPDPRRGADGPLWVEQPAEPAPLFEAVLDAAVATGLPRFASTNGELMEADAGCAVRDQNVRGGARQSPWAAYALPALATENLTVLHGSTVAEVVLEGTGESARATGVRLADGTVLTARQEVVLCLGAVGTPTALLRSGIGDADDLRRTGLDVCVHAPAVGRGLHDHAMVSVVFSATDGWDLPVAGTSDVALLWNLSPDSQDPPVVVYVNPEPFFSRDVAEQVSAPQRAVSLLVGVQMRSRGQVDLDPTDPSGSARIRTGFLSSDTDVRPVLRAVKRVREVAAAAPLRAWLGGEVFPGSTSDRNGLASAVRAQAETFWHQSGTARMGADGDADAVLDSRLRVRGVRGLRVADASVLPHVTVANTMAPCVVVGEQAAAFIAEESPR